MAECTFASVDGVAQCAKVAAEWILAASPFIQLGLAILGVSSAVSIGVLTWYLRNSRQDITHWKGVANYLRSVATEALQAQQEAEEKELRSSQHLGKALDELKSLRSPVDEQRAREQAELQHTRRRLERLTEISQGDGASFWTAAHAAARQGDYERNLRNSIPVCVFANQKGGVGKTTLSANVAAVFAERGERVLAVDMDYQGSLTGLMLAQSGTYPEEFPSTVNLLLADTLNPLWAGTAISNAKENLDFISCWYSFEQLERRLEHAWSINDKPDDVRYRLARAVLSSHIQRSYDRIIIDLPPRMTAGFVNGICASTHLFIPTVVDRVSAVAVGTFARQFRRLRDECNTVIELGGIIGTMTARQSVSSRLTAPIEKANSVANSALHTDQDYFFRDSLMARTTQITYSTEDGIAYCHSETNVRQMFERIADNVALKAPRRPASWSPPN